jgi:Pectinacetylesterase
MDATHPTLDAGNDVRIGQSDNSARPVPGKDATSSDSGSTPDASDAAPTDVPFDATGFTPADAGNAVITEATPETWSWIPFAGSKCRDGSTTGIGVNLNPASQKVMIFLEGGGACFNEITCGENPSTFGAPDFAARFPSVSDGGAPESGQGIMDRNPANPVSDWNFVYVPYCTGDIHAGNNPNGSIQHLAGTQAFVGYANIDLYLQRLVPTFANATQVLLTGASGGGFGAAANYAHVQRAFGSVPVDLIDDSGPYMEDPYLPACLQTQIRTLWGVDSTLGADCAGACNDPNSFFLDFAKSVVTKNPQRQFGLMESMDDGTITTFFGFGNDDCMVTLGQESPTMFAAGLTDIRTQLAADTNAGTFYFPGTDHTSLEDDNYYTRVAGTTPLTTWVGALVGGSTSNVGP